MDPSKIGGFFSGKEPLNPLNSPDKANKNKDKTSTNQISNADNSELSGLFKLPASKVVSKLSSLLEKSLADPKVEKLVTEYKVPANSRQALAFCTYACVKQLVGGKFNISADDEKSLLEAIKEEYEEDANKPLDPDEKKKRKRERRKKSKKTVNALMCLIEEAICHLEKGKEQSLSLEL